MDRSKQLTNGGEATERRRRRPDTRRLLATLLVAVVASVGVPAAPAAAQDNSAVAVNTKDGTSVIDFSFSLARVMGSVVDNQNAAVAFSSCQSCRAVAVAIQIVLVMGDPEVVTPENYAIAVNQLCSLCESMALAYQIVIGVDGPVRLTPEGLRALAQIRLALAKLERDAKDLTLEEIRVAVEDIVAQLKEVLSTQLVPAGTEDAGEDEVPVEDDDDEADPTPTPDEQPTPPEEEEATPAPTPTPEPTS
ncbi:MAG TPA: hypothetical protein VM784_04685 [Actinomycetota bacterium]|nr:hypothetical protein [Actinomycetota bacterium]